MSSIQPLGVTLAMVVVACAGQSRAPASAPQPGTLPDCSTRTADGSVVHAEYPPGLMEAWLKSDAALRQRYGKSEVDDCADAERLAVLYWQRGAERFDNPLPQLPAASAEMSTLVNGREYATRVTARHADTTARHSAVARGVPVSSLASTASQRDVLGQHTAEE